MEELRKQQQLLAQHQKKLGRLVRLFGIATLMNLLVFLILIIYIVVISRGNKESSCGVIETSRAEKRVVLAQYAENPPTTPLGREIEEAYKQSLASWDQLWNRLGCKGSSHGG